MIAPEHDPGTTAAPGDAAGRAAPNGNAGRGFGAGDGAGTAGGASCRVADLIAEARRRVAGHTFSTWHMEAAPDALRGDILAAFLADEVARLHADLAEERRARAHAEWQAAMWRTTADAHATVIGEDLHPELEQLRADAARWRALIGSARIRVLGSARLGQSDGHIGLELWGEYPAAMAPPSVQDVNRADLIAYADGVATPTPAAPGARGA